MEKKEIKWYNMYVKIGISQPANYQKIRRNPPMLDASYYQAADEIMAQYEPEA